MITSALAPLVRPSVDAAIEQRFHLDLAPRLRHTPSRQPGAVLGGCCAPDTASVVLDELCRMQLRSFDVLATCDLPWLSGRGPRCALDAYADAVGPFLEAHAADLDDEVTDLLERLALDAGGRLERPGRLLDVVQHGDLRPGTVLLGRPVRFVGWGGVRRGHPLLDVAAFLGASLGVEERRSEERALLRDHHAALQADGRIAGRFDSWWDGYRHASVHGVLHAVSAAVDQTRPAADRFALRQCVPRAARQVLDLLRA